jgi:hypothetical protein
MLPMASPTTLGSTRTFRSGGAGNGIRVTRPTATPATLTVARLVKARRAREGGGPVLREEPPPLAEKEDRRREEEEPGEDEELDRNLDGGPRFHREPHLEAPATPAPSSAASRNCNQRRGTISSIDVGEWSSTTRDRNQPPSAAPR